MGCLLFIVLFILGRLSSAKRPGLFWIPPFISRMIKVDLRIVRLAVLAQEAITRDNVTLKVTAVVYFHFVVVQAEWLGNQDLKEVSQN